ncbi:MAG: DEDD exonuclease domain-containing protein [Propionibacteriaceae bacterium]|jgi:DNA polymerase-3 subunit epsilon|nr:DEDD exonuclease domain-containing protein [Propionibacteriaceae bacterium]
MEPNLERDEQGVWDSPTLPFGDDWFAPDSPSGNNDDIALSQVTFCVIDLETTGMGPAARITEIGAVKTRGGEHVGEFHTLVNPEIPVPGFITALTGITNAMVRRAPTIDLVFSSLVEFTRGCVMVAHNASFDMGFLLREAERLGYDWPSRTVIDTLSLSRRVIPRSDIPKYTLDALSQYFDVPHSPTHRALDDVLATVSILHALLELVGNQGVETLADLLAFSRVLSRARREKRCWADDLPEKPGVYLFVRNAERGREVLYVGTSKNIRKRVRTYFTAAENRSRMEEMIALATGVEAVECHTALEAAIVELRCIKAHQPPYNKRSKRPRHTWVKLTTEPIPRLSVVRKMSADQASYLGPFSGSEPAEVAIDALTGAFALRPCTHRLSTRTPREPCALAEMGSCPAPCTLSELGAYSDIVERARASLTQDVRGVRQANRARIGELSEQLRYEEAAETLERLQVFETALKRGARLRSLSSCANIVAARAVGAYWEIHVVRYGTLACAGIARPGDDPARVAQLLVESAGTVVPQVDSMPAGLIEEAELIASWMELPGVRLLDIEGTWGWPVNVG